MKFPKRQKVKKTGAEYSAFIREVFERDGWACRRCQMRSRLQVHHLIKRSNIRLDTLENCVTLCASCHKDVERGRVLILGEDANDVIAFRFPLQSN